MSTEENKAVIRLFYAIMGDLDGPVEMIDENRVDHAAPPGLQLRPTGFRQYMGPFYAAFSDVQVTIEQMLAEEDLVATHWTARFTHQGELMGIPLTGKAVMITGTAIDRVAGGKITESWGNPTNWGCSNRSGLSGRRVPPRLPNLDPTPGSHGQTPGSAASGELGPDPSGGWCPLPLHPPQRPAHAQA